jgi:protein phosphatase PTC7
MMALQDRVLPDHQKRDAVPVAEGDIIIAGTDGLFDNLFDEEIVKIAEETLEQAFDKNRPFASSLSEKIVRRAISSSLDSSVKSPFSVQANKIGRTYSGGKPDDTTVIVSLVVKAN